MEKKHSKKYNRSSIEMVKEEKKLVDEATQISNKKKETYEWKINQRIKNKIPNGIRAQLASLNNFKLRTKYHRVLGKPELIKMYPAKSSNKKTLNIITQ